MKKVLSVLFVLAFALALVPPAAMAAEAPELSAQSAVLAAVSDDGKYDIILYEKNADEKLYPASLTKIMTAILALENVEDLDGTKVALKQYIQDMLYGQNASLGGILLGEEVSMRGLLYASMLQSANEASLMIGDYLGDGSLTQFAEMMNCLPD